MATSTTNQPVIVNNQPGIAAPDTTVPATVGDPNTPPVDPNVITPDPGTLPGTTTVPTVPTDTTGTGSGLFSGLSSLLPGGSNAPTGMAIAGTGLGLAAASEAQQDIANLANQEIGLGKPFVDAAGKDLAAYQAGTISPQEQAAADYLKSVGATNVSEAAPLMQLGNTYLGYAQTGTLPPAVQAQLDQQTAAAKAAALQQYGGDSSAASAVLGQIDMQAALTKQNMINQYGQQGQQYYNAGTTLQQQGQADTAAGYQAIVNDIQQNLNNAISEATTGFGPIEQGIQTEIQGDAAIADALMGMFGELYKNVAANSAGGGGTTTSGGGGGGGAGTGAGVGGGGGGYGATPATNAALTSAGNMIANPMVPTTPTVDPTTGALIYTGNVLSGPSGITTGTSLDPNAYVPGTTVNQNQPYTAGGNIPGTSFNPNMPDPWASSGATSSGVEIQNPDGTYSPAVPGAVGGGANIAPTGAPSDVLGNISSSFYNGSFQSPPSYSSYVNYVA
jgi:hypothetical protein